VAIILERPDADTGALAQDQRASGSFGEHIIGYGHFVSDTGATAGSTSSCSSMTARGGKFLADER